MFSSASHSVVECGDALAVTSLAEGPNMMDDDKWQNHDPHFVQTLIR